jgi:serine/threonine-protein kinase
VNDKADPVEPTRLGGNDVTRIPSGRAPTGDVAPLLATPQWAESKPAPDPAPAPAQSLLQPGTVLNNTQRIEALVGRGGMGEVYRATNIHTGDQDAIKMIRPDLASDPQVRELFRREAAALRKVRHPSVVSYEGVFGDDSGRLFLVMEFVDGPSLASLIARAPLAPADVRRIGVQIAEGLATAHACGVVHRDLSPDNVVLRGGSLDNAVLIDFGVAKRLDATSTVVGSGFAGKLDYCSPEQCGLYDGVDHRTDIYSLGLVLVAAALGRHLPMGSSLAHAVKARETRPDLSAVPDELRADLQRLVEPDPARRPQSMREVAALLGYAAAAPAPATAASAPRRAAWIVTGAVAMVALFVAGIVIGPRLMAPSGGAPTTAADKTTPPTPPGDAQQRAADAARQTAEAERRAAEAQQRAAEEAQRLASERAAAEQRRLDEQARRKTEAAARAAEETARRAEAERLAAEEAQRRAEEEARRETGARAAEEARRRAEAEAQRRAEEARRRAEEDQRPAAEAQRKADDERRRREAAAPAASPPAATPTPPAAPAPSRPASQQAARPAPPATIDGAWRGQICFRRLALTPGNETCGPLTLTVAAGNANGNWVVNSVTYGIVGSLNGEAGQLTLDLPPTGRGSTLGATFNLPVRLNGGALQGQGYTRNDVLVMFSASR